jgi:hypothetical protein
LEADAKEDKMQSLPDKYETWIEQAKPKQTLTPIQDTTDRNVNWKPFIGLFAVVVGLIALFFLVQYIVPIVIGAVCLGIFLRLFLGAWSDQ